MAYILSAVQADLTCLGWGLISPVVGLFCHFEPTYFKAAENRTAAVVEEAVQSTENLIKFDLTHNPAIVAYNFIDQTNKGGINQGDQYLNNITQDFENVAIGFGKETSNQVITILELTYWNDLSLCLIEGAAGLALHTQQKNRLAKRVGSLRTSSPPRGHRMSINQPSPNDSLYEMQPSTNSTPSMIQPQPNEAVTMAHACISDKFKQLAKPVTFHINNTNQKIGSTLSDLAGFLIPIGGEEKAAAGAADALEGAVDLAIPGSESTTRVVKMVSENTGDHFANEKEAQAVKDSMKDKSWVKENCGVCGNSPVPLGNPVLKKKRKRDDDQGLYRRGDTMASCCRLSTITEDDVPIYDPSFSPERVELYSPKAYKTITEADLIPPPNLPIRNIQSAEDIKALKNDLDTLSTGLVEWSPELKGAMGSDEVLSTFRNIFTGKQDSKLYQALEIQTVDNGYRMHTNSDIWIKQRDPMLQPLQAWVNAAANDGIDTVMSLKGMPADMKKHFKSVIDFFYTAPGRRARTGTDPRGFHMDNGLMQFGVADTPGLVVLNSVSQKASRVPVAKDAFHLLKANLWDYDALMARSPQGPTYHSVFGKEMAKKGRVSIIMSIGMPSVSI